MYIDERPTKYYYNVVLIFNIKDLCRIQCTLTNGYLNTTTMLSPTYILKDPWRNQCTLMNGQMNTSKMMSPLITTIVNDFWRNRYDLMNGQQNPPKSMSSLTTSTVITRSMEESLYSVNGLINTSKMTTSVPASIVKLNQDLRRKKCTLISGQLNTPEI